MEAVTLREIIEDPSKQVQDFGEWRTGPIPAAQFPIRRQKRLKLSHAWSWRVIRMRSDRHEFLVLITLNTEIGSYSARLAIKKSEEWAVICTHDLHVSHKNWHCHFVKGDITRTATGFLRDKENTVYFPSGGIEIPCTVEFNVSLTNAVQIAAARYRFKPPAQSELEI